MTSLKGRHTLSDAKKVADKVYSALGNYCSQMAICGSVRRERPIVGDIDVIVAEPFYPRFLEAVKQLDPSISLGSVSVKFTMMVDGIAVDVLIVEAAGWGAAMMHSTGPVGENIRLRAAAKRQHMVLNQYGLWDANGVRVAGLTEKQVYEKLGLKFIPPTERDESSAFFSR